MPSTVATGRNSIRLNDVEFPLAEPVRTFIASATPPKQMQGEFRLDTHPYLSTMEWRDHRGGIGKDVFEESDPNRSWWSTASLRHRGHLVLPRRTVTTASAGTTTAVGFIGTLANSVYASFGTDVRAYTNATDSWGSSLRTLAAAATDAITVAIGGTETLIVAQGTDVDFTTDGSSWNRDTTDVEFLAFWRNLVWGVGSDGTTYFSSNLSNGFTEDSRILLEDSAVTSLFVGPSPDPRNTEGLLYAGTQRGLFVYDALNSRWAKAGPDVPLHQNNGAGALAWRSDIYFPAGHAIYKFSPVQGTTELMGPDQDDGLPSDRRGVITTMAGTHNGLFIGLNSQTGSVTAVDTFLGTETFYEPSIWMARDSGTPSVLGWAGGNPPFGQGGWEVKWGNGTSGDAIEFLHVSTAYNEYRAWWGSGGRVFYQTLPTDIVNPQQVTSTEYAASAVWETPWVTVSGNQSGVALKAFMETRNPTSSNTVTLAHATNFVESFTNLGTQSSAGEQSYNFVDSSSDPTGVAFTAIRFRATLSSSAAGSNNTPDMVKLAFAYRRPFSFLKGFRTIFDLTKPFNGRSVRELENQLDTILQTTTQMRFSYRDETDSSEVFWVSVLPQYAGLETETGRNERGTHALTLVEAIG